MIFHHRARLLLGSAAALGLALWSQGAAAQTLEVTASVPDACTVGSGSLAFGDYTPGQATDLIESGSFDVTCTIEADVNVRLDGGLHTGAGGTNGDRAMTNDGQSDFLSYRLYHEADLSTEWGDDGNGHQGTSKSFQFLAQTTSVTVTGRIGALQTPIGGEYSDTVQISLVFN
jgi:spore coat protein U-like protein